MIRNEEPFECCICFDNCATGDGIVLRNCLHQFCKDCISEMIIKSTDCEVQCPYKNDQLLGCDGIIEEREMRAILPEDKFNSYMLMKRNLSLKMVKNSFPCNTADCAGIWIVEDGDKEFKCNVCGALNCIKCKAIHKGLSCDQYADVKSGNPALSAKYIDALVRDGTAMRCPRCNGVIMKSAGCDGMKCGYCHVEICWVTKGLRWGPGGKGDITGGCRCKVNGKKCHVNCKNCH